MKPVALIGCGFVADLYMRSFALYPELRVAGVFDRDAKRLAAFCAHWGVRGFDSRETLFGALPEGALVVNLTNPGAHFEVTSAALAAGFHVFSEKPLVPDMAQARALHAQAAAAGLMLGAAPSSVLGEAAQTLGHALRSGVAGTARLVYAELDDGFVTQAPYRDWVSASGAPWPWADEFATGCTLEHAGYYLSWLIAWFGPVRHVTATSARLAAATLPEGEAGPDFSLAALSFDNGVVARLTTSIVASHDHGLRIFGDKGVLAMKRAWDNSAPVRFHARYRIRRRLVENPLGKRIRLAGPTHPKVSREGAAAMNFALGPVEMLSAQAAGRASRINADFALHLNEVTLAIAAAGPEGTTQAMRTSCTAMEPMPWAR